MLAQLIFFASVGTLVVFAGYWFIREARQDNYRVHRFHGSTHPDWVRLAAKLQKLAHRAEVYEQKGKYRKVVKLTQRGMRVIDKLQRAGLSSNEIYDLLAKTSKEG